MINPITGNKAYFLAYMLICIIFGMIQASIEFFIFDTSLDFALADSIIYNFLFFILGIAIWFPVRYMSFSEKRVMSSILNHLLLGGVMLVIWIGSGYFLIKLVIGGDALSLQFLEQSMPYRSVLGALILVLMILLYYLMVYSENLKQKINNEASLKTLVREAELNALKAQINPHFLFNSLNSISSLTIRDPTKARKMIIELSDFLRYSLKHKEVEETSVEEEIQNITRYLEIEKIRFEGRLIFEMDVPKDCGKLRLPNMILQPLFENAIKHGVYESLDPITISLKGECNAGFLILTMINDFDPGLPPKKGNGIGLRNIRSRLKLIYGKDGLIETSETNQIFKVVLRIPIK